MDGEIDGGNKLKDSMWRNIQTTTYNPFIFKYLPCTIELFNIKNQHYINIFEKR